MPRISKIGGPIDGVRPELVRLRDHIRSTSIEDPYVPRDTGGRIVPVTREDVVQRLTLIRDHLVGNPIDVPALAARFQIPLEGPDFERKVFDSQVMRGYDVPPELSLTSLYAEPSPQPTVDGYLTAPPKFYSLCFGLNRSLGDFKAGSVLPFWKYPDLPELDVNQANVDFSANPTGWTKLHVIIPEDGPPAVDVNPIQLSRVAPQEKPAVLDELARMKQNADPKALRSLEYRGRLLDAEGTSPFLYRDRGIALALLGLRVAELVGATSVGIFGGFAEVSDEKIHEAIHRREDGRPPTFTSQDLHYLKIMAALRRGNSGFPIGNIHQYTYP